MGQDKVIEFWERLCNFVPPPSVASYYSSVISIHRGNVAYRRPTRVYHNQPTGANQPFLKWDMNLKAYELSMPYIKGQTEGFLAILKQMIPSSERTYDPLTKKWHFVEKSKDGSTDYFNAVKIMFVKTFPNAKILSKEEVEKFAQGWQSNNIGTRAIPIETDLGTFARLTGADFDKLKSVGIAEATKLYRQSAFRLHPDRNPDNAEAFADMATLNEVWAILKGAYFK